MRTNLFKRAVSGALADALVETPRALPLAKPQRQLVSTPGGLPGLIPFGPSPPGMQQSSRYTGGSVPNPMSLTHGEDLPTFQSPNYGTDGAAQGASPLIAALAANAPRAASGAVAGPPPRPPGLPPAPTNPNVVPIGGSFGAAGPHGGGLKGAGGGYTTLPGPARPNLTPTQPSLVPYSQPGAALIAALAQIGQRLGTSRSAPSFY